MDSNIGNSFLNSPLETNRVDDTCPSSFSNTGSGANSVISKVSSSAPMREKGLEMSSYESIVYLYPSNLRISGSNS